MTTQLLSPIVRTRIAARIAVRMATRTTLRALAVAALVMVSGCALLQKPGTGTPAAPAPAKPTAEDVFKQQRVERAKTHLAEGLARYEAGNYVEAINSLLLAVDGGVLPVTDQLVARKHMAFMHAVNNRESNCRDEFEKAFLLDPKFELTAAEAGHPVWGPIYRATKADVEFRKTGRAPPPAPKVQTAGERMLADAVALYDQGEYSKALKVFQDTLKETLSVPDRVKALKLTAFSYCLTNRNALCRATFDNLLQLKPDFVLDAAEAGHPSWGPSFRAVKSKQSAPKK
jgi:tetratricopeptide (TPR) repeat protein